MKKQINQMMVGNHHNTKKTTKEESRRILETGNMSNINYFDTPQEQRNNSLGVKWMNYLLGKTYKRTRNIYNSLKPRIEEDSKYDGEPKESDLFIHKKDD